MRKGQPLISPLIKLEVVPVYSLFIHNSFLLINANFQSSFVIYFLKNY
jgi:hypothetical protein